MPTIHFMGKILPRVVNITINHVPEVSWVAEALGLTLKFTIRIKDSVIDVQCDADRFEGDYLPHCYMRAVDLARASVDLVSFVTAKGFTVFLDTFVGANGMPSLLIQEQANLTAFVTAFKMNTQSKEENATFDRVYQLVLSEPALFMALNDLIVSITLPHHASVNCARAIEGLRNIIAPPGIDRKKGWASLRDNLHVEREYLEFVTEYSTAARHGDRTHIPGPIVIEITKRAWIIMNRFLEFRKRGNCPLPESEFPTLSS
jgi:hypothetical protein